MIDVGTCVEEYLWASSSSSFVRCLSEEFQCSESSAISFAAYLASLHDIGKATPEFQGADPELKDKLVASGNGELFDNNRKSKVHHECWSGRIMDRIWKAQGNVDIRCRQAYCAVLACHHQRTERIEPQLDHKPWYAVQEALEQHVRQVFQPPEKLPVPKHADAVCMLLSGVLILCDWVASSTPFDVIKGEGTAYIEEARQIAHRTVSTYGLVSEQVFPTVDGFQSMWPMISDPRAVQKACEKLDEQAALTIIEAPMGEGKTEAALYMAARKCNASNKRGIYVALPTQATSNQMIGRMNQMLESLNVGPARLLHGMAFLQEETHIQSEDAAEAERWLRPLRMGLLGENAVGTVDQAMAGVLLRKFSLLRLLGLANKTLIIDELHAYDAYMSEIIEKLLIWCKALHVPVILLSATLQRAQRERYIGCYTDSMPELSGAYPLLTQVAQDGTVTQTAEGATLQSEYTFMPLAIGDEPEAIAQAALSRIQHGGCLCVLVNTVRKAQQVYAALRDAAAADVQTMLFHARFPVGRRAEIEKDCLALFGRSADANRPAKAILVATQVVEQSLDIDFDGMISELAPIDLLLQRAGRVHRHRERVRPHGLERPEIQVLLPQDGEIDLSKRYGSSGYVYAPFLLNNTEHLVEEGVTIRVPEQVREVIEKVYDKVTDENWLEAQKLSFSQDLMGANAAGVCLPVPSDRTFYRTQITREMERIADTDDGFESTAHASTRLGEPTWRIAFCTKEQREMVEQGRLDKRLAKALFMRSVTLRLPSLRKDALGGLYMVERGMLRGCLLTDQPDQINLCGMHITNDPVLGVIMEGT